MTTPAFVEYVCVLGTQLHIIRNDGAVFTLGRVDQISANPLEWQELPPVPDTPRAALLAQASALANLPISSTGNGSRA